MTMKAHIAKSGKNEGRYVPCPAKQHCRVASAAEHVEFAGQKELDMYNEVSADGGSMFDEGTAISGILEHHAPTTEGGKAAAHALSWAVDERGKLTHGETLADGEHEETMKAIYQGTDALWGPYQGLKPETGKPTGESRIAGSGDVVRTHGNWHYRFDRDFSSSAKDKGEVHNPIYSNGNTLVSFSDAGGEGEDMTVTTKQSPRSTVRYSNRQGGTLFNLQGNDVGSALNRVTECVQDNLEGYKDVSVDVNVDGKDGDDTTFDIRCKTPDGRERSMTIDQPMFERAFPNEIVKDPHDIIETLKRGFDSSKIG